MKASARGEEAFEAAADNHESVIQDGEGQTLLTGAVHWPRKCNEDRARRDVVSSEPELLSALKARWGGHPIWLC